MTGNRKTRRFKLADKAQVNFIYDFQADLNVSQSADHEQASYKAMAKNVSVQGLCFHCDKKLGEGEIINLEYFVPGDSHPIHMKGEVRWSKEDHVDKEDHGFDTGVKLTTIEGHPVIDSIYYDNTYQVYWSDVLEMILGKFRILRQGNPQKG